MSSDHCVVMFVRTFKLKYTVLCVAFAFILSLGVTAPSMANQVKFQSRLSDYARQMAHTLGVCLPLKTEQQPSFHGCGGWAVAVPATWALMWYGFVTGEETYVPLVESRLTPERLEREVIRIQQFPNADKTEARAWLLRLYVMDRLVNGSERLRPLAALAALQIRQRMLRALKSNQPSLETFGMASLFVQEYATVIKDESLAATVGRLVDAGQRACAQTQTCSGARAHLWWGASAPDDPVPYLSVALQSERAYLLKSEIKSDIYGEMLKSPTYDWLERFRQDPLTNVYGLWAVLPVLNKRVQ